MHSLMHSIEERYGIFKKLKMAVLFYLKGALGSLNICIRLIRNSTFDLHLRFSTFFGNQDDYISTNERKVQPLVFIIRAEKCI